jgi:hypothetical protein
MAMRAAALSIQAGHHALIGSVQAPGDHAFCVVDYPSSAGCPQHIQDMNWYLWEDAWVIDPWMNISCAFHEFPSKALVKFQVWSPQGKRILYGDKWEPYDPTDEVYSNGFFKNGPLRFDKVNLVPTRHPPSGAEGLVPWIVGMRE